MIHAPAGLTRVSQQQIGATEQTCVADGLCVGPDVLTAAIALVGTVTFAIAFGLALSRLHEATEMLEVEQERTERERDAFETFVERIAVMSPTNPTLTDGGRSTIGGAPPGGLTSVLEAYRDTVMALPHYDAEYDDTLQEHMTAELGDDVALAVQSSAVLSPQLQRTLCARGLEAKERRDRLLDALDAEGTSLTESRETLVDLDETFADVEETVDTDGSTGPTASRTADWHRIHEAERSLRSLLESRQRDIQDQRHVVGGGDGPTALYEYVYDDLPTSYPILSVGTRFLERAASLRQDVARVLAG